MNEQRKRNEADPQENISDFKRNKETLSKSRKKELNIISKIMFGQSGNVGKESQKYKIDDILNDLTNISKNYSNQTKMDSNRKKFGNITINSNLIFSESKKRKNNVGFDGIPSTSSNVWTKIGHIKRKISMLSSPNSKENIFSTTNYNNEQVTTETNQNNNNNNNSVNIMNEYSNSSEKMIGSVSSLNKGKSERNSNKTNILVLDTLKASKNNSSKNVKLVSSDTNWRNIFPQFLNQVHAQEQTHQKDSSMPLSFIIDDKANNTNQGLKKKIYTRKAIKGANRIKPTLTTKLNTKKAPRPFSHIQKSKTKMLEYNDNSIAILNQTGSNDNNDSNELSNRRFDYITKQNGEQPAPTNPWPWTWLSFKYNPSKSPTQNHEKEREKIKNKEDYFSKLANMDDKKFSKIMQIVDELSNDEIKQESQSLVKSNIDSTNIGSINYYKANSINFGDININYNHTLSQLSRKEPNLVQFSFWILSTYNWYSNVFGLTEIQWYDKNNNYIPIIKYKTNSASFSPSLPQWFNGVFKTTNESEMFVGKLIPNLKIDIYIDKAYDIDKIIIWNYNGKDLTKGVQNIEIYRKNNLIWRGIIHKGSNKINSDYSTIINVGHNSKKSVGNSSHYTTLKNSHLSSNKNYTNSARNPFQFSTILSDHDDHPGVNCRESKRKETNSIEEDSLNTSNTNYDNSYEKSNLRTSIGQSSYHMLMNSKQTPTEKNTSFSNISDNYTGTIITCNKIKIILASNYGHRKFIGWTGIWFLDENKKVINIETASTIGAWPKDVHTYYEDSDDYRIFENVFNQYLWTTESNQMWLTVLKPNEPLPFLEWYFEEQIKISMIKIFNFNAPDELDKCTKSIELFFDDHWPFPTYHETIILHKGIGESDIDYSQDITFPVQYIVYKDYELAPFKNQKSASFLYNQCYETPFWPSGFYLKMSFISNYGDYDIIGVDNIEIYDQCGRDVWKKRKGEFKIVNKQAYVTNSKDIDEVLSMKYNNWFLEGNTDETQNNLYFFFKNPIAVSYIQITNCTRNEEEGVKDIQIFLEDNVIFAGELNKGNKTIILFTCDMGITKGLDENYLSQPKVNCNKGKRDCVYLDGVYSMKLVDDK